MKFLVTALVLLPTLLFTGCPPAMDPNALRGLGDFSAGSGSPGELVYSFSETVPSASFHTLYYVRGLETNAANIIAEGNGVPVFAGLDRVLSGFTFGENYSVVVVSRRTGFADVVSGVEHVEISRPASLTDLEIRPGASPGELLYSFTATIPPATYIMYYIQGNVEGVNEIMDNGNSRSLNAGSWIVIDGFAPGESYSIVVIAESVGGNVVSNIMRVRTSADLTFGVDELNVRRGGYNPYNKHRVPPVGRNHIELVYSFGLPVPAAESYTLYFLQGMESNPANIIRHGSGTQLDIGDSELSGFTTGLGLSVDHEYSVLIVARGASGEDLYSAIVIVPRVSNNILIVHGIPESVEVMVSAILTGYTAADLMFDRFDVDAVGYRIPGTGMFVFYRLDEYEEYDPNTPWIATETRFVTLSDSEEDGVGSQFIVHGGGAVRLPARIEVTNRLELTWTQFMMDFR